MCIGKNMRKTLMPMAAPKPRDRKRVPEKYPTSTGGRQRGELRMYNVITAPIPIESMLIHNVAGNMIAIFHLFGLGLVKTFHT